VRGPRPEPGFVEQSPQPGRDVAPVRVVGARHGQPGATVHDAGRVVQVVRPERHHELRLAEVQALLDAVVAAVVEVRSHVPVPEHREL
jgi:hypothetical protein